MPHGNMSPNIIHTYNLCILGMKSTGAITCPLGGVVRVSYQEDIGGPPFLLCAFSSLCHHLLPWSPCSRLVAYCGGQNYLEKLAAIGVMGRKIPSPRCTQQPNCTGSLCVSLQRIWWHWPLTQCTGTRSKGTSSPGPDPGPMCCGEDSAPCSAGSS